MEQVLRILLVDDDEIDRMAVRRSLLKAGLEVAIVEANNCAQAIAILKNTDFDCVFVDYRLPDQNGLTLIQTLRSVGVRVPLVALTGQGDEQIAVDLMKAGASDYLSKARLSPEVLSQQLKNVLRVYQAEEEAAIATQRLEESEERYRFVLEGSNDGIWDWDMMQDKFYCNDRLLEIVGLSRSEFAGTYGAFCDFIHPDDRDRNAQAVTQHLEQNDLYDIELRFCAPSGELRHCVIRAKAQRNEAGIPYRMAGVMIDISERKQTEDALARQNELLKRTIAERDQIARQREDFVSRLTHDLRTPLVAADRVLHLLKDGTFGATSPDMDEMFVNMIRSNENLLQMVNTLLEVYRYEAGCKSLTFAPVNLWDLARETLQELAPLADGKRLPLVLDPDEQAIATGGAVLSDFRILGDRLELRRVLTNLVGNAIKFTQQGAVTVRLHREADMLTQESRYPLAWVVMDVEDTGCGVPEEDQEFIFDRFRQSRDRRAGSGLGLYLSRQIVEAHQGSLHFTSQVGKGSHFTARFLATR
jgi:PAS domain S-box-containing protein